MERKTPLYDIHVEEGGKIVPFAGYLLPVQYETGIIAEHEAVRTGAGKSQRLQSWASTMPTSFSLYARFMARLLRCRGGSVCSAVS